MPRDFENGLFLGVGLSFIIMSFMITVSHPAEKMISYKKAPLSLQMTEVKQARQVGDSIIYETLQFSIDGSLLKYNVDSTKSQDATHFIQLPIATRK